MTSQKPPMGWNSWNTFAQNINEDLIMEIANVMAEEGRRNTYQTLTPLNECNRKDNLFREETALD